VVPDRISAVIFRQLLYQHSRVREGGERRHCRNDDPLGQGARQSDCNCMMISLPPYEDTFIRPALVQAAWQC
jgi:hypothetical protein